MQAFCIALLLCLGAGRSIPVSKSRDILKDDLNSLPEDVLRHISSQLPVVDRLLLSETSSSLRGVAKLNDAEMVSVLLLSHFGNETCLFFALSIEEAPPGFMTRVVTELLRSKAKRSLQAACMACTVGYVELIDVISDEFLGVNLFRDVADLATLPTSELLKMHALPKLTFLQVLSDKYKHAGYGAFFKDQAWYSQYCSYTVMSHALHLYNELNGAIDFEPVPFGHIAATQTLSERTQGALRNMASDLIETRLRPGISEECFYTFSLLQLVLSPGAEIQFFSKSSSAFRTEFLVTACKTGRLDWFMVNHDVWSDAKVSYSDLRIEGWYSSCRTMRLADVRAVGDPVMYAFKMLFRHQMKHLSLEESRKLCKDLLVTSHICTKQLFIDHLSATNA